MHRLIITSLLLFLTGNAYAESNSKVNYSGFWKNDCKNPYGIQIELYKDGFYTTRFCGPGGGCDTPPDTSQLTTIEGDPRYEVVSPTEIREKEGDTVYSVLYKCTSDTNPVLKYSDEVLYEERRNLVYSIAIHIIYFLSALAITRMLWLRFSPQTRKKRLVCRSAVLAIFFSPGLFYSFPFAVPTFAFLALIYQLFSVVTGTYLFLLPQLMFSIVPMLTIWLLLIIGGLIIQQYQGPAHNLGQKEDD